MFIHIYFIYWHQRYWLDWKWRNKVVKNRGFVALEQKRETLPGFFAFITYFFYIHNHALYFYYGDFILQNRRIVHDQLYYFLKQQIAEPV